MGNELPYYKMYPADFENDQNVEVMDNLQRGVYLRFLNSAWKNDGIPVDEKAQAALAGEPLVRYRKSIWPRVSPCWKPNPNDASKLINPRQEKEREEAIALVNKNRRNGGLGGRPTKPPLTSGKPSDNPTVFVKEANGSLRTYDSGSGSGSSVSSGGGVGGGPRLDPLAADAWAGFVAMWAECGGAGCSGPDWTDASWEWQRMDTEQRIGSMRGLMQRKGLDDPALLRGLPKNYLEKRKWERDIQPAQPPPRREDKADAALKLMKERSQ